MSNMNKRAIIIDTDPGQDDAVAILLALASDEISLLGLTTIAGNVSVEQTTENALKICELANHKDVKVYKGASSPLSRKLVTAEHVHGKTGLDGPDLPKPTMQAQQQHAVDFLIDTLRAQPSGTVTLCPLGPLTNIATAMEKAPDIIPKIDEIVLMGGGYFEGGNITPAAEFNIYVDPQAAHIVFKSGVPIVMAPLDCTHKALTGAVWIEQLRAVKTSVCDAVADLMEFFERFDEEKYGTDGAPLHDPCVIAYLLKPDLFKGKMCNVEIETQSELTMGMTVIDWWQVTDRPHNALVLGDVNTKGMLDLITERISKL